MSLLGRLTRGSDDLDTPAEALIPLIPYLPKQVWEPCPGRGALTYALEKNNVNVIETFTDFMETDGPASMCEAIVTNPPFSKKAKFISRCMELGKPWALLLPVTTLGVRACQKNLINCQFLFLPRRIDFTGKRAPWFAVMWVCYGLGLPRDVNFMGLA